MGRAVDLLAGCRDGIDLRLCWRKREVWGVRMEQAAGQAMHYARDIVDYFSCRVLKEVLVMIGFFILFILSILVKPGYQGIAILFPRLRLDCSPIK